MVPEVYTQYVRPSEDVCPFETHVDEGKVERIGYESVEKMVNKMLRAGQTLKMFSNAEFLAEQQIPENVDGVLIYKTVQDFFLELQQEMDIPDEKEESVEEVLEDKGDKNVSEEKENGT